MTKRQHEHELAVELYRLHELVDDFAKFMEKRLDMKARDGARGWCDPQWSIDDIKSQLCRSAILGRAVDAANFAMFLAWHQNLAGKPSAAPGGSGAIGGGTSNPVGEAGPGFLEVGVNGQRQVVINLDHDRTGHVVFSPSEARTLAGILSRKAKEAEKKAPAP